jgi:hypothetical protein
MLLDLAETEPFDRLRAIAEEAERRRLLDLRAVRACMNRNPGRRGLAPLGRLLREHLPVTVPTRASSAGFQDFVTEERFPMPQCNVFVAGLLVDFWWPEARLVVELDSHEFHSHWSAVERDHERAAKLMRLGIYTLRVTHRRLTRDRAGLSADIGARFSHAGAGLRRVARSGAAAPFR